MKAAYFSDTWITRSDELIDVDLCVYGATAAGCISACTAVELGASVIVLHPGQIIGGMTTGGLGNTDVGNPAILGGLAKSFYERMAAHYRAKYEGYRPGMAFLFEPSVAMKTLEAMISEHSVTIRRGEFLDRVVLSSAPGGSRITELRTIGGLRVRAGSYVDATYEGDLLAAAEVSYTVGRESTHTYDESMNGFQVKENHQFAEPVDPYITPGTPESGLLPGLEHALHYTSRDLDSVQGTADRRMQAYNFRVCMELDTGNQRPFERPDGYDPARYELCARWLQTFPKDALSDPRAHSRPFKIDRISPTKSDTNNWGAFSSDFIGGNYDWPTADYARRQKLFEAHACYQQGYYYFMTSDPRVPLHLREEYSRWGLASDEFVETENWPHQLYIREGRRLVSDYVITEHDCTGRRACSDTIALAAYAMDSHNTQRIILDGAVKNEGNVEARLPGPYGISYRATIPSHGECSNLAVPVAVSASHIAFGSVRMEPVFMMLAEASTVAALMSAESSEPLQALDYSRLSPELAKRSLVLDTNIPNEGTGHMTAEEIFGM
ncbi:MAG: FAD-dependent oxidoreductase [Spirochaetota bacterium]